MNNNLLKIEISNIQLTIIGWKTNKLRSMTEKHPLGDFICSECEKTEIEHRST